MAALDIVIPVYNQARQLGKCLASIRQQTFEDYLVVIVDDGSTDHPENQIYIPDTRIRIIHQQRKGASAARNVGAGKGSAPDILFCDADINLKPQTLSYYYQTLQQNSNFSYTYSSFKYGFKTFRCGAFDAKRLRSMPYIHTTALILREHFPGFDESLKRFQDWDLWLTMLEQGHTGIWIDEVLFTIQPGGTISHWLPQAAYRLFPWLPAVRDYQTAIQIIKRKHGLS